MRRSPRELGVPLILGAGSFALAFAQRPGLATADTKINLHVDPGRFLSDVASMWTSTGQLGDVQAGQQAGYLFPMGPFFALGHAVGLPDWVVQRLWLGALLALTAWGVVRLLDALLPSPRGIAALTAGTVMILNPFVVTYANRTTVTLLAYAALPWLMLVVHRGLRDSRGWRWPAAFALLVTASGGGINGAVTAWMLLGPVLLGIYELAFTEVTWPQVRGFLARMAPLTLLASLWWVLPAYVQSSYGINFLHFTEQPGTVWGTTSATESLRLMSFWLSYVGVGFNGHAIPYFDDSHTLLFSVPVVIAGLLVPALALGGFAWTRRWRFGPFFLGLGLVGVIVMMAGFPEGTPLRHGLNFSYNHFSAVQFLRASYKAAPLLALALACLAGAGAGSLWCWLGSRRSAVWWRWGAGVAGLAVLVGAAWPLVSGIAQDAQVSFHKVPAAWRQAAGDLDRELPANSRAIVLPGDLFSFYTWGGTVDPIGPALSSRPVAERSQVPYADVRATDLLWTIDGLVHQDRLLPGQLAPLLSLIGVRSVITASDDDLARSDAPPPADAAAQLAAQPGFARAARTYGARRRFAPTGLGSSVVLPEVRRYDLPAARGLVRVEPRAAPVVVDGSASALAGLAAFGALPAHRSLIYAADLTPAQLHGALAGGGDLVIGDSNRREAFVPGSLEQNTGPVLTSEQEVSADGLILDPFGQGPDYETVAAYTGVRSVEAPASPLVAQFPEHAPFAAIDGSPATSWLADPTLDPSQRWLQVDFSHPRDIPYVELEPYGDAGGTVNRVQIAGRSFAVAPGLNRLLLGLHGVLSLRVTITGVGAPRPGATAGAGGITELRIPGVHATQALRLPVDAAQALTGGALRSSGLTYLFQRTTGDDPFARDPAAGLPAAPEVYRPGDAEQTMRRVFKLPALRTFRASAWVSSSFQAPDDTLDRLAGYRGPVRVTSSSRFDGEPQWRGSRALDGARGTAWIADYTPAHPAWLAVRSRRDLTVSSLTLTPAAAPVRRPTEIRVLWPGGSTPTLAVGRAGVIALPHRVRARWLRIEVTGVSAAQRGASPAEQRAVGIAELSGIRGLTPVRAPRRRAFTAPCGTVRMRVGGQAVALAVGGSAAAFERGGALAAHSCGVPLTLGVGAKTLAVAPGPLLVDALRLFSPAPVPQPPVLDTGHVLDSGHAGRGSYDGVRVAVTLPSWLVLGEGYDRGWRATCNGHSLGAPVPIDGYANGWRVAPGCRHVSFTFAPSRIAAIGYLISGLAGLVCLVLLLVGAWRARGRSADRAAVVAGREAPEPRWALARALGVSVLAGAVFGFVFGLGPGLVAVLGTALILWRGIGARALTLAAGGLLAVVVPFLYVIKPGDTGGGNHFGYAMSHLTAHYVGVVAIGLLMAALWRSLRAGRAPD